MSIGVSYKTALEDIMVIKPLPVVSIKNPFKYPDIGFRFSNGNNPNRYNGQPYIENFQPPKYMPNPHDVKYSSVSVQPLANDFKQTCPTQPILLRNEWETVNTGNGKYMGGFDPYNIHNIPSCIERDGEYTTWYDFVKPEGNIWVNQYIDSPVVWGTMSRK